MRHRRLPRTPRRHGAPRAHERLPAAPRARRRRHRDRRPLRARAPAAVDHRRRARPAADGHRRRALLDRLQRRGLQLPRPARRAAGARAAPSRPTPTPRSCSRRSRSGDPTRSTGSTACSGWRSGTATSSGSPWRATTSASSRSTSPGSPHPDRRRRGAPVLERDQADPRQRALREEGQRALRLPLPALPGARGRHRDVLRRDRAARARRDAHGRRGRHPAPHVHPPEGGAPRARVRPAPLRRRRGRGVQAAPRRVGAAAPAVGGAGGHEPLGRPRLQRGRGHHQPAAQRGRRAVDPLGRHPPEHVLGGLPRARSTTRSATSTTSSTSAPATSTRTRSCRPPTSSRPTCSTSSAPRRSRSSPRARTRSSR